MATILVVDDNAVNRSLLTTILGYGGHKLLEADNGAEALAKAQSEPLDLVITDILMPQMDGYELVGHLRKLENAKNTPIIFYSAMYLEKEARSLADACGISKVLCKPAEPEQILREVEEALASKQPAELPTDHGESHAAVVRILNDKLYRKVEEVENANRTLQRVILERERAEAEAAEYREARLKMKGEFLSHVSHELRSPLTVVHQFTTILLDGLAGNLNFRQREYLEIALRNADQLKYMINDLLEASRADTGKLTFKPSVVLAMESISQVVRSQAGTARQKQIILKSQIVGDLPAVYADPVRVCQILTNLLDNALKFSPPDSVVNVRAEVLPEEPEFVRISVSDQGCGIDPEHAERVFDRLYQVKDAVKASRQGLGLGLYICREILNMHGGGIWVESKRMTGTTIHFTLPVYALANLIAPAVVKGGELASSVVLLTIQFHPGAPGETAGDRERALGKARQVVQRCILPDVDVLLPVQSCEGSDLFAIVARTDQRGADAMLARFREQLAGCRELQERGVHYSMNSEVLNLGPLKDWSPEKYIAEVTATIKDKLKITTTKGVVLSHAK